MTEAAEVVRYVFVGDADSFLEAAEQIRSGSLAADRAVDQLGTTSDRSFKKASKSAVDYKKVLGAVGAATAAVAASAALAAKKTLEYTARADELRKTARAIGASAEEYQVLTGALEDLAGRGEMTAAATLKLNQRIGMAKEGSKEATHALSLLRLEAEELEQLSLDERFAVIADRLQEFGSDADRTRILVSLFEEQGRELKGVFDQGGDAILAAAEATRQAGIVSNEAAAAAEQLQHDVDLASRSIGSLVDDALARGIPDMGEFARAIDAAARAAAADDGFQNLIANISDVTLGALRATAALVGLDVEMGLPEGQRLGKRIGELQGELQGLQDLLDLTTDLTHENAEAFLSGTASLGIYGSINERVTEIVERMNAAQLELDETEERSLQRTRELIEERRKALEVDKERERGTRTLTQTLEAANDTGAEVSFNVSDWLDGIQDAFDDLDDLVDQIDEFAAKAEETAARTAAAYQSIVEKAAAATTQLTGLVVDAIGREMRETEREVEDLERAITRARDRGTKQRLRIEKDAKEKELEEQKKAAMAAWVIHQVAAIAEATVSLALGIANSLAMGGPQGIAFAVASGIAGAAAIAAIAATPPPSFHSGGLNMMAGTAGMGASTPDSRMIRARDGEFISNNNGRRAIGLERLRAANRTGRDPGAGGMVANFYWNDRLVDRTFGGAAARRGSAAEQAVRGEPAGRFRNPRAA